MIVSLLAVSIAQQMIPTGKLITPIGTQTQVGQYPVNSVAIPGKDLAAITGVGYQQFLTIVNTKTGAIVSQIDYKHRRANPNRDGLYYGLAVHPKTGEVFASNGAQDKVTAYALSESGELTQSRVISNPAPKDRGIPYHFAGIAFNSNGSRLLVVNNQTASATDLKGSVSLYQTDTGKELFSLPVSGFPLACAYITKGQNADAKAYVASERDGRLDVIDLKSKKVSRTITVGQAPQALVFNRAQTRLYVSNAASDTISIINTQTDKVLDTISLRPNDLRGLPGAGPIGIALSPDEKTLYTTLGDMNAVASVDLKKASLTGYFPTGWLPTSIIATNENFLVTNAKGSDALNPNADKTYIQDTIAGTVSLIPNTITKDLKKQSIQVVKNNRLKPGLNTNKPAGFTNPGAKYVIYVIKENRTYDNVLSDIEKGNGDPSLCMFPREVTPNQHALAERFVLLDNFYVCAEVSQDGWVWSTAGMINPYASRNTVYNYGGRGRSYDTEGTNNGVPTDLIGITDVTRPASGYIWEHCEKNKISFRNYGMFSMSSDIEDKRLTDILYVKENFPTQKLLEKNTNVNYRKYDLTYPDSEIYAEYDYSWPRQTKTYGENKSTSRFQEWNREFQSFVKKGEMPRFQMVRMGQDHTSGSQNGQPTAKSMVADNDYAVGQLVEAVSKSKFWKDTVICILEDDAQNGYDHVDAHRSTAYVISPYIKKATHDSTFYNTDSMLRTMCLILGLGPMSQYDAVASPINVFSKAAENLEPFTAIKPSREIVCAVNTSASYRSLDSEKIPHQSEESEIDEELNDILWGEIKGVNAPRPIIRRGFELGKILGLVEED
jgi:YVTN family beta-propeller protein